MKRIDGLDRAENLFGAGKDGFQGQVPGVSLATQLSEAWFNAVQEAVVRTIEAAGLVLSETDFDQFTDAVIWIAAQAAAGKVTQGGGAGQIVGAVKIGAAAGGKLKAEVASVDFGNIAFEAWVSSQIAAAHAALVNGAPGALDQLNELAAAMGNDANYAASVANSLAGKERKFDTGTRMLFQQTAAPIGWTKVTTHDNKALRVVSGAVGSGGAVGFTAAFVNGSVGGTALTIAQIPAHGGHVMASMGSGTVLEEAVASNNYGTESLGGGQAHSHTINLDVMYVDIIIASKD